MGNNKLASKDLYFEIRIERLRGDRLKKAKADCRTAYPDYEEFDKAKLLDTQRVC